MPRTMLAGTVLDTRFELVSAAAEGAVGRLFRAVDRSTQHVVAVKVLHDRSFGQDERFAREAAILAQLDHPSIVRAIAHGVTLSGEPWLVMEWVEGDELAAFLRRPPRCSVAAAVTMMVEVARGLGHAHAHGVVHRDVKPSNILLADGDPSRPRIIDFGLARGLSPALTETGQLVGTPCYMAPEQARGDRAIGPAADVYALGCVLYETLTGERAFDGQHAGAVIEKILAGVRPRASAMRPDLPPGLDEAIGAMLDPDPRRRPADGSAAAAVLATVAAALPSPSAHTIASVVEEREGSAPRSGRGGDHLAPGVLVADRFVVGAAVGAGGMGTVYRAHDRVLDRAVALKLQDRRTAPDLERFEREARALAALTHGAIVRYVAHGTTAHGEPYLAMEWLEGNDLAARLLRGRLTIDETRALLLRVAEGLAAAHGRGIVHRDIKPSNLFLVADDVKQAVIVDFGIARSTAEIALTTTGRALGTPGYMAPEQMLGHRDIDARADVFALGCVAFECLAGHPPFAGDDGLPAPMRALLVDAPRVREVRKDVPAPLDTLVARLLARDRDQRPENAAAIALALVVAESPGDAITRDERRAASVLVATLRDASPATLATASKIAREHAAKIDRTEAGVIRVTFSPETRAPDQQAIAAARCALQLGANGCVSAIAITSGLLLGARGEILDVVSQRTGTLVEASRGRGGAIRVDTQTASEIEHRFQIARDGAGSWLEDEAVARGRRTVLGKSTGCVGRDRELATLAGAFASVCSDETAASVFLVGEAGIGKSRVVDELIARLVQRSEMQTLLRGAGEPMRAGSPFAPLADVVRDWSQVSSATSVEARREALVARITELGAGTDMRDPLRTAVFLGELAGIPFPPESHPALSAARADARVMGDSIRGAWEELLVSLSIRGPVLLAIEDLHWGDVGTVRLLGSTLRRLRDRPLFVLLTARPEIDDMFPELFSGKDPTIDRLQLEPLGERAATRLVQQVLGEGRDSAGAAEIVEGARGNPLFIEELLRAAGDRAETQASSDTLAALLRRRLDAFDLETRRVLRAASVFGTRFTRAGVAALLGVDAADEELARRLSDLVARETIAHAATPSTFLFRHALLRDASYGSFTDEDRRLAHALAATFLEGGDAPDAVALAEHFELAGRRKHAARWYARSATLAVESGDLKSALARAARGLDCEPERELRVDLLALQADAHFYAGAVGPAVECALLASASADPGSPRWYRALAAAITAAGQKGDNDKVEEWCVAAEAPAAPAARDAQLTCLGRGATQLYAAGRAGPANAAMDTVERLASAAPPDTHDARAWVARARGARASAERCFDVSVRELETTTREHEASGDERSACLARVLVGSLHALLGSLGDAEPRLLAARAVAERLGIDYLVSWAEYGLGKVSALRGDLPRARERLHGVVAVLAGSPRIVAGAHVYLSIAEHRAGDAVAAAREAEAALALQPAATMQAAARAALARAHALRGDSEGALAEATRARTVLRELGDTLVEFEGIVRLAYAEALRASGRDDEARTEIDLAARSVREGASALADPAARASYLESIEVHARILRFARSWTEPQGVITP